MPRIGRDQVLVADDLRQDEVEVPEWGGSLLLRELSALGWKRYASASSKLEGEEPTQHEMALLVALSAVDDQGEPVFNQPGDVERLSRKSSKALRRAYEVALRLSTATDDAQKEAAGG